MLKESYIFIPESLCSYSLVTYFVSQEEEALLNEMEVTGQAFEDMQEQNSRLIQQLREKDDANFKLMTERIKSNQLHKLAREEKDVLKEQVYNNRHIIAKYLAYCTFSM